VGSVELVDLTVARGGTPVLHGVDLRVDDGERIALLGPSGAGTSSLLGALLRLTVDPADVHVFAPDGPAVAHGV